MFYLFAAGTKNAEYQRTGLRMVPGADFDATGTIFEPEPVPRLPGPAVGPKGPKSVKNPGPDS